MFDHKRLDFPGNKPSFIRTVGIAGDRLWGNVAFFLGFLLIDKLGELEGSIFFWYFIVYSVALFVYGAAYRFFEGLFFRKSVRIGIAVIGILGTLVLIASRVFILPAMLIMATAFFCAGSLAFTRVSYGFLHASCNPKVSSIEIVVAFLLSAALFIGITMLPEALTGVFFFAAMLASLICFLPQESAPLKAENREEPGGQAEISESAFILRVSLCCLIIGLVEGIQRDFMVTEASAQVYPDTYFYGVLFVSTAILVSITYIHSINLNWVWKTIIVLMVIGSLSLPFFSFESYYISSIPRIGFAAFEILIWVIVANACKMRRYAPFRAFGFTQAGIYFGVMLGRFSGYILSFVVPENVDSFVFYSAVASINVLVLLFLFMSVMPSRSLQLNTREEGFDYVADDAKVLLFAKAFQLTSREAEVLSRLIEGHSKNRIKQELYVSSGTINTHFRHIYQKVGVHSKQELLDSYEEFTAEDRNDNAI